MKTTIENVQFYLDLVNAQGTIELYLQRENGTNYLRTMKGKETIFSGTLTECYYFLVGAQKLINPMFNDYTVNGTFRTFMVVDSHERSYFCNINNLNRVIEQNGLKEGYFSIFHFYNNKLKKTSKKALKLFFEGAHLKQNFNY